MNGGAIVIEDENDIAPIDPILPKFIVKDLQVKNITDTAIQLTILPDISSSVNITRFYFINNRFDLINNTDPVVLIENGFSDTIVNNLSTIVHFTKTFISQCDAASLYNVLGNQSELMIHLILDNINVSNCQIFNDSYVYIENADLTASNINVTTGEESVAFIEAINPRVIIIDHVFIHGFVLLVENKYINSSLNVCECVFKATHYNVLFR